jgi:hypothetical protein
MPERESDFIQTLPNKLKLGGPHNCQPTGKEFYRVAMQASECIPSTNQVPPLPLNPMRKTWLLWTVTNGGT